MAGTLSAGVNSLILKLDTPYDTIRTSDIRDDLIKVKVWSSTTAGFTPSDANKVFDGLSLSIIIPNLTPGTTYYVRYAFISEIDEAQITYSSELSGVPIVASAQTVDISGYSAFVKNSAGTAFTPATAGLAAVLNGITTPVYAWTITGGTLSSSNTASTTVTPALSATSVSVTLSVTGVGIITPIVKTIVMAIVNEAASPPKYATAYLYQWATTANTPTGSSTYTWTTGANSGYTGSDGWSTTVPTNPGTALLKLWTATKPISALASATTTTIDWTSGAVVGSISQNGAFGATGSTGVAGVNAVTVRVYKPAITIPSPPTGSSTHQLQLAGYRVKLYGPQQLV